MGLLDRKSLAEDVERPICGNIQTSFRIKRTDN